MKDEFFREKAAIAAMQSLLHQIIWVPEYDLRPKLEKEIARDAVIMADALIAELSKPQGHEISVPISGPKESLDVPLEFPHVHEAPVEVTK